MMEMKVQVHTTSCPMAFLCALKLEDLVKFVPINYNKNNNKSFFGGVIFAFIVWYFLSYVPPRIFCV